MTPAATSSVDGVLGGRAWELEPGAALYLCGPAIAQQKRHRPECGHRLEALGATDYVRIRWYGRAKQHRLAYGARLSHRGTVVQHRACTCALAATTNFASGGKKDGGLRRYHRYHTLGRGDPLWAASSASSGAPNSAICYAQLRTTRSRGRELGLDSPIGRKLWT